MKFCFIYFVLFCFECLYVPLVVHSKDSRTFGINSHTFILAVQFKKKHWCLFLLKADSLLCLTGFTLR